MPQLPPCLLRSMERTGSPLDSFFLSFLPTPTHPIPSPTSPSMFRPLVRRSATPLSQRLVRPQPLSIRLLATQAPDIPSKVTTPEEAVKHIKSGNTVLSSGFGLCGVPQTLINAIAENSDIKNLTCVSNNAGSGEKGLGE